MAKDMDENATIIRLGIEQWFDPGIDKVDSRFLAMSSSAR